jgi:hypothetical protein
MCSNGYWANEFVHQRNRRELDIAKSPHVGLKIVWEDQVIVWLLAERYCEDQWHLE